MSPKKTPTSKAGLAQYDKMPPSDAALKAWITPGPNPAWHEQQRNLVRDTMPLLGRALDRAAGIAPKENR